MFGPMFSDPVNLLGLPSGLIILGLGIVGAVAGLWWIRHALEIEPETHSFRATAPDRPNIALRAGLGLGLVVLLTLALAAIAVPR